MLSTPVFWGSMFVAAYLNNYTVIYLGVLGAMFYWCVSQYIYYNYYNTNSNDLLDSLIELSNSFKIDKRKINDFISEN